MVLIDDLKHKAFCFYERSDTLSVLRVLLSDGTSSNVLFRTGQFFQKIYLTPVAWLIFELNKMLNGCVIGQKTIFGRGFVLMHPIGVVINGGVKAGRNVVIESSVVIGAARNGYPVLVPTIGDNVFIGSGAKVLGGICIGSNVTIAANAVVIHDVPNDVTVAGVPAKIVKHH